uniref:8.9 kDa family member n=1 Tax=Rhipicephalus appendiculatus TaxID=34631 RepID=A0A131YSF9_RHIAP
MTSQSMPMVAKLVLISLLIHLVLSAEIQRFNKTKKTRLNCTHNGETWQHGDFNNTNPECRFYWCRNGKMKIKKCPMELPRRSGYGNCMLESVGGKFPHCCNYQQLC